MSTTDAAGSEAGMGTSVAAGKDSTARNRCRPGRASGHAPQEAPRPSAPKNGTRPVPGTKKAFRKTEVLQNA